MKNFLSLNAFRYGLLKILSASVWLSCLLFGLYILGFYAQALITDDLLRWNTVLPGLYNKSNPVATGGIGIHFLGGGIVLILGSIQLVPILREKLPRFHRIIGSLYIICCTFAGFGGLLFIFSNRTIGGLPMDIGFGLYGILTITASFMTGYMAYRGNFAGHRAWAIRLYSLAVGSWFYRMGYGFWFLLTDKLGHTSSFSGPFDYFMDFFFYIPNLLIAEWIIRAKSLKNSHVFQWVTVIVLVITITYVWTATFFFTSKYWMSGIKNLF
jgi:hypothetical protein